MAKAGELEYLVVDVPADEEQAKLSELGQERWMLTFVLTLDVPHQDWVERRLYLARNKDCGCGCGGCDE